MRFHDTEDSAYDIVMRWLTQDGYEDLHAWMEDSDYSFSDVSEEWHDAAGYMVDPFEMAFAAMEAEDGPLYQLWLHGSD
jgi:hypothetical protein